jgi:hypothetical protein
MLSAIKANESLFLYDTYKNGINKNVKHTFNLHLFFVIQFWNVYGINHDIIIKSMNMLKKF